MMTALGVILLIIGILSILCFFSLTNRPQPRIDRLAMYYLICGGMNVAGGIMIIFGGE